MLIQYSSGAAGDKVSRPFVPENAAQVGAPERIATALEYIATALARIDHNFETFVIHAKSKDGRWPCG